MIITQVSLGSTYQRSSNLPPNSFCASHKLGTLFSDCDSGGDGKFVASPLGQAGWGIAAGCWWIIAAKERTRAMGKKAMFFIDRMPYMIVHQLASLFNDRVMLLSYSSLIILNNFWGQSSIASIQTNLTHYLF